MGRDFGPNHCYTLTGRRWAVLVLMIGIRLAKKTWQTRMACQAYARAALKCLYNRFYEKSMQKTAQFKT